MKKLIKYTFLMGMLLGTLNVFGMKGDGIDPDEFRKRLSVWQDRYAKSHQEADQARNNSGNNRRSVAQPRTQTSGSLDVKDVTVPQAPAPQPLPSNVGQATPLASNVGQAKVKVKEEPKKADALASKFNALSLTSQDQQPAPAHIPAKFIQALFSQHTDSDDSPTQFVDGLELACAKVWQKYDTKQVTVQILTTVFTDWFENIYSEDMDINEILDNEGKTPLHIAAKRNNKDLCIMILASEADPLRRDNRGISPLMIAVGNQNPEIYTLFFQIYAATKNPDLVMRKSTIAEIDRQLADARGITALKNGVVQATRDFFEFQNPKAQAKPGKVNPTATTGKDPVVGVDGEVPQICNKGANSENQMMLYGDGEDGEEE